MFGGNNSVEITERFPFCNNEKMEEINEIFNKKFDSFNVSGFEEEIHFIFDNMLETNTDFLDPLFQKGELLIWFKAFKPFLDEPGQKGSFSFSNMMSQYLNHLKYKAHPTSILYNRRPFFNDLNDQNVENTKKMKNILFLTEEEAISRNLSLFERSEMFKISYIFNDVLSFREYMIELFAKLYQFSEVIKQNIIEMLENKAFNSDLNNKFNFLKSNGIINNSVNSKILQILGVSKINQDNNTSFTIHLFKDFQKLKTKSI